MNNMPKIFLKLYSFCMLHKHTSLNSPDSVLVDFV